MLTIFLGVLDTKEEKDKLTQIYETYYGTMLSVARGILFDKAMAEDTVSDSIMTIIDNLHKINDISNHKTRGYIVIIVRSRAINLLNKYKRYKEDPINDLEIMDDGISVLDTLTIEESCNKIISIIKELPKTLSDVLYLSVVMENSNTEIAKLLNLSNDVVRKRLSRAKSQIRIRLIQKGD